MTALSGVKANVEEILSGLPDGVELIAAAKMRTPEEIKEAIDAGVKTIGENYVQEAVRVFDAIGRAVKWHFIGHLQKNKVRKAVEIFDMIETVDLELLAEEISKRSEALGKVMPVLVEINSGEEISKFGVRVSEARGFVEKIARFPGIKVMGLMTMGPVTGKGGDARPYFSATREAFEDMKSKPVERAEMRYLSMGMTDTYIAAIAEGANMVRIGTKIFGKRER